MATATKRSAKTPLTPTQQAHARAEKIIALRKQIDSLEDQLAKETDALREYALETGERTIGPLLAYERSSTPRLVCASGKAMEMFQEQLTNQLPETYWKKKLDVSRMLAGLDTDFNLRALLVEKGLSIEASTSLYFKEVK